MTVSFHVLVCVALLGVACRRERKLTADDVGVYVGRGMYEVSNPFERMGTPERPLSSRDVGTVVLQFKDSDGTLAYASPVPKRHGLELKSRHELGALIEQYRSRGFRVIGYLQVFKDAAFANAHPSEAVRDSKGEETFRDRYGAFIDPMSTKYASYFLELVAELSKYPIDELMLDYIRYPEYQYGKLTFPHSPRDHAARGQAIATFVRQVRSTLAPRIRLSTALFAGSSAIGVFQNYELICQSADLISPMMYPSLFHFPGSSWTGRFERLMAGAEVPGSCAGKVRPFFQGYAPPPVEGDNQLSIDLMRYQLAEAARRGWRVLVFNSRSRYTNLVKAME